MIRDSTATAEWRAAGASRLFFAGVFDGLGGHNGGQQASLAVASRLATTVSRWASDCPSDALRAGLLDALADAHRELNDTGRMDPTLLGMGTTATGLLIAPDAVLLLHVGDSRCYRKRDGLWKQLTTDHTIAERDSENRIVTRLTHAIGASLVELPESSVIDMSELVFAGDVYLLVTDGVLAATGGDDSTEYTFDAKDAEAILTSALANGGPDNATAVLLEILA